MMTCHEFCDIRSVRFRVPTLIPNIMCPCQIRLDLPSLQPIPTLRIQNIPLGPMGIQTHLRRLADFGFAPRKVLVPTRILGHVFLRDLKTSLAGTYGHHLVLVEQQCIEHGAPPPGPFSEHGGKATISFIVHLEVFDGHAASYCGFHLRYRSVTLQVDGMASDAVQGIKHAVLLRREGFLIGFDEVIDAALGP